jgi:MerR HTH family regulatory protein
MAGFWEGVGLSEPRDIEKRLDIKPDVLRDWRRRFPGLMGGIGEQDESGRWRYRPHHFIQLAIVRELRAAGIEISRALRIASRAFPHVLSWLSFDTLDPANREFRFVLAWERPSGQLDFDDLRNRSIVPEFGRPLAFCIDTFEIAKAIEPRINDKTRRSRTR